MTSYRHVSFYARVTFLKLYISDTKFPLKMLCFLGVRGLTASYYMVYDYTTSGHMELYIERERVCVCIYIYIICTLIYNVLIYF